MNKAIYALIAASLLLPMAADHAREWRGCANAGGGEYLMFGLVFLLFWGIGRLRSDA